MGRKGVRDMLIEIADLINKYFAASCRTPTQITMTYTIYEKFCKWSLETGYRINSYLLSEQKDVFPTEILGMKIVLVEQGDMDVSGNASDDFQMYLSNKDNTKKTSDKIISKEKLSKLKTLRAYDIATEKLAK